MTKWRTNQLDEKTVSTSIVPFETCPAVDAIAKDRARGVNVPNRKESVETAYLEDWEIVKTDNLHPNLLQIQATAI